MGSANGWNVSWWPTGTQRSEMPFMLFPTNFILLFVLGKFQSKLLCNYLINSKFCYFQLYYQAS